MGKGREGNQMLTHVHSRGERAETRKGGGSEGHVLAGHFKEVWKDHDGWAGRSSSQSCL